MAIKIINLIGFFIWLITSIWLTGYASTIIIFSFISILLFFHIKSFPNNIYEIITIITIGLIGISWIIAGGNISIFLMSMSFIYFFIKKRRIITNQNSLVSIKKIISDIDYSIAIVILVLISLNAIQTNDGIYLHDKFHPIYEHGMGHSFSQSLFNPPDLSYYGKNVRWHFLSTQISRMFENFGVGFIQSIYSVTPSILFILFFLLFKQICYDKNQFKLTGLLFFFPLGYFSMLDSLVAYGVPSVSLSVILILLCYYYFEQKEYLIYLALSVFLCFSKAPFFLVLIGFSLLKYIFSESKQKIQYAYLFLIQFTTFVTIYIFYYGDVHTHNNWILFGFIRNLIVYRDFLYIVLPFCILMYLIISGMKKTTLKVYNSELIGISGIIGYLFLIESTESNHNYFLLASMPFIIISFLERNLFRVYFFVIMWTFFTMSNNPKFRVGISNYIIIPIQHLKIKTEELINSPQGKNKPFDFSHEKKSLYSNLKNITKNRNSLIWFPNIYESGYDFLKDQDYYWPEDGFFRSSVSNKQFFLENMKYKAILMEEDFHLRFAQSLIWYQKYVEPSEENKDKYLLLIDMLKQNSLEPNTNIPEYKGVRNKILNLISLNEIQSYNNSTIKIKMSKIFTEFQNLKNNNHYAIDNRITHIVLESGDKLKNYNLNNKWKLVYSDNESQIWEINNMSE